MSKRNKKGDGQPRIAEEIMAGMRELRGMMEEGRSWMGMFRVRRVAVGNSEVCRAWLSGDGPKRS